MLKSKLVFLFSIFLSSIIGCSKDDSNIKGGVAIEDGDYYVAPWGNNLDPGTFEKPWATWQRAVEMAIPGDIIYIRGGVYKPTAPVGSSAALMLIRPKLGIGRNGKQGSPICYFAYPGETPILDGSLINPKNNFNVGINIEYAEFLHFKGLTIRNIFQYRYPVQAHGIAAVPCANLTFENCTVHNISGRGYYFESGAWAPKYGPDPPFENDITSFINCDAFNVCDSIDHTSQTNGIPGNAADAYKLINFDYNMLYITGCRAWNYSDDGFDVNPFGQVEVKNSWAFSSMDTLTIGGVIYTLEGNGFKISARKTPYAPYPTYSAALITNCLAAFCYGNGFYNNIENDYQNNAIYLNNTSYKNGYGFGQPYRGDDPVLGTIYKNNLVYKSQRISAIGEPYECALGKRPYIESHNTWDYYSGYPYFIISDSVKVFDDDFVSIIPSKLSSPRDPLDNSLPDIDFLRLKKDSDFKRAGINVGMSDPAPIGIDWDYLDIKK